MLLYVIWWQGLCIDLAPSNQTSDLCTFTLVINLIWYTYKTILNQFNNSFILLTCMNTRFRLITKLSFNLNLQTHNWWLNTKNNQFSDTWALLLFKFSFFATSGKVLFCVKASGQYGIRVQNFYTFKYTKLFKCWVTRHTEKKNVITCMSVLTCFI